MKSAKVTGKISTTAFQGKFPIHFLLVLLTVIVVVVLKHHHPHNQRIPHYNHNSAVSLVLCVDGLQSMVQNVINDDKQERNSQLK